MERSNCDRPRRHKQSQQPVIASCPWKNPLLTISSAGSIIEDRRVHSISRVLASNRSPTSGTAIIGRRGFEATRPAQSSALVLALTLESINPPTHPHDFPCLPPYRKPRPRLLPVGATASSAAARSLYWVRIIASSFREVQGGCPGFTVAEFKSFRE